LPKKKLITKSVKRFSKPETEASAPEQKDLNRDSGIKAVGIGMDGEVYQMFCPACAHEMVDLIFKDQGMEFPEKQCPICLTIYQLASASRKGASTVREVILAPRTKEWLKENGDKHIRGALIGSW